MEIEGYEGSFVVAPDIQEQLDAIHEKIARTEKAIERFGATKRLKRCLEWLYEERDELEEELYYLENKYDGVFEEV